MAETEQETAQARVEDLGVLMPDATVEAGGRTVTVREFRFGEAMRVTPVARPILRGLRELFETHGEALPPDEVLALMGEHHEAWLRLLAVSTGEDEAWIRELPDGDGAVLQMTFWQVNRRFFTHRLILAASLARGRSGSSTSSASSSPPGTEPTPRSSPSATPGGRSSATGAPSGDGGTTGGRTP